MSVMAFNNTVALPIASQSFFDAYWREAIEQMNLPLLAPLVHGIHVEVTADNWQQLAQELQIVQQWASDTQFPPDSTFMIQRAQGILDALPGLFEKPGATLTIAT